MSSKAEAALVTFKSYSGKVAVSNDGWGGSDGLGVISASAPSGSKVVAAYLYTATQNSASVPTTVTLDGNSISYETSGILPPPACCSLRSYRADVTSIVKSKVDGGAGGVYDFDISEGFNNSMIDGSALVVVYENAALPDASVGILDGYASVDGDTTSINFADPLDADDPDFFAEMSLGISFSCCDVQRSTVTVNGDLLTENAGNYDDGENLANGSLITVGGFDDPLSDGGDSYTDDHERYNLASFITDGDTSIKVDTANASRDDNIFLATFYVKGKAGFNEPPDPSAVPLPASMWLLGASLLGMGALRRRMKA